MRKFVGIAFGALILLVVAAAGIGLLRESIAQGDSLIPAGLVLAVPVLLAGALVAAGLQRLIGPLQRHRTVTGVIGLVISAGLAAGLYAQNSSIPLQRPDAAVTAAVAPACAGQAVAAAGRVANGSAALNHIVVLDATGAEFDWTGKPTIDWRPPTVDDVELVACVQPDDVENVIQVCEYNGPSTTRYSATREIRVVAAQTGVEVASFSITDEPDACPFVKSGDVNEIADQRRVVGGRGPPRIRSCAPARSRTPTPMRLSGAGGEHRAGREHRVRVDAPSRPPTSARSHWRVRSRRGS